MVASTTSDIIPPEDASYYSGENIQNAVPNNTAEKPIAKPNAVKTQIVWRNVFLMTYIHITAIYGLYLCLCGTYNRSTWIITVILAHCTAFGTTAGAHRLWAHKSYKAKLPLEIALAFMQSMACQNSIYEWCRDHRVHHKYTETDADPHNAKRGFFFAHVGWLLTRKHPDVFTKGRNVDMSDLEANPVVAFQKKYYIPLAAFSGFIFPIMAYYYLCGEKFIPSLSLTVLRYVLSLNFTWLVNSAAHLWGSKPYDKTINPVQNTVVSVLAFGEGHHNYHHVFPWDYKTAELGKYKANITCAFIDLCAYLGLAYDLKTVPKDIVAQRVARTGDGSHHHHHDESTSPWGWDDKDAPNESKEVTEILYQLNSKSE